MPSLAVDVVIASFLLAATSISSRVVAWLPSGTREHWLPWLQSVAVGLLVGDSLLHVLPHALETSTDVLTVMVFAAAGSASLVVVESVVRYSTRAAASGLAPFARMNLVGDFVHHIVDGVILGGAFAAGAPAGYAALVAIALHEVPREIGSAGVLVAAGYDPRRAFVLSVAMACAVPIGAFVMLLGSPSTGSASLLSAFAAGTILHVALADILPGVWNRARGLVRLSPALGVGAGIVFMWAMAWGESH